MEGLLWIGAMVGIGALIGGVTNSLAIHMLFRPFHPVYVAGRRLPFTPGLIPKRRNELAEQMGRMVTEHLLTAEGVQKQLHDADFQANMKRWAQEESRTLLHREESLAEFLETYTGSKDMVDQAEEAVRTAVQRRLYMWLQAQRAKPLKELLPEEIQNYSETRIQQAAYYILERAEDYIQTKEGEKQLKHFVEKFLEGRGSFVNFIGSMVGSDRVVARAQPEILRFLQDDTSKVWVEKRLREEWLRLQHKPVAELEERLPVAELIEQIAEETTAELPVRKWLEEPLNTWAPRFEDEVVNVWVPKLTDAAGRLLAERLPDILQTLHLDDVVKKEVQTFEVSRIETLVLTISRREFTMIKYLGAFLGAGIGLLQGIVVVFVM